MREVPFDDWYSVEDIVSCLDVSPSELLSKLVTADKETIKG